MKTYLVTGAAGFIGAALAKRLLDDGNRVVTIDNLSTGYRENIPEGCEAIIGNTYDEEIIKQLEKYQFDAIYHIAGQSCGEISFSDPVYDMNSNITSTLLLLKYAKETGCKRFLYASSMSVYGDENPCPVDESAELKPKSFYAVGKLASERYMRLYAQFGIKSTALRLNNVYGPGQNLENLRQGMASIFIAQAIRDRHIHVHGAKERFRDFVFIDDVVESFVQAENGQESDLFNIYTIATNRKTTVEELIRLIQENLPFAVTVEYEGSTPGDQFGIYCSYEKIRQSLGWAPNVKLEDGLQIMLRWALEKR